MSLKKIGSRDSTAFELEGIAGESSKVLGDSHVPWAENMDYYFELLPGRYRIDRTETSKTRTFSRYTWQSTGDYNASIFYLETDSSGSVVFFDGGGTVFITRLA